MSEEVTELTNKKEFENFIRENVALVDFYADWCVPCVMMAPVMEELSKKFKGKIKFGRTHVNDNRELAQKFKIMSIPNFILFKDGKIKEQFVGAMPPEDFEDKLKKHL